MIFTTDRESPNLNTLTRAECPSSNASQKPKAQICDE